MSTYQSRVRAPSANIVLAIFIQACFLPISIGLAGCNNSSSTTPPPLPSPSVSVSVVGGTQASYPTTDGSSWNGNGYNGTFSILTRGQGQTTLTFSTIIGIYTSGPPAGGQMRSVWVDPASGDVFVGGRTAATNTIPATSGSFQSTYKGGPDDAVVCRFSSVGTVKWCSYFGTGGTAVEETVYGIAGLDPSGNLAVCGSMNRMANGTSFDGITTTGLGTATANHLEAYVAKIKPDGTALVWYTSFGTSSGSIQNRGRCVVDSQGNVYGETGLAGGLTWITSGAFQQAALNAATSSIYELAADGSHFIWASYLGGTNSTNNNAEDGMVFDSNGDLYIPANTTSTDFFAGSGGTGYQSTIPAGAGHTACAIAHIKGDGSAILHSTFFAGTTDNSGGSADENTECMNVTLDASGHVYVIGHTYYKDLPTTSGAYRTGHSPSNQSNGFVAEFSPDLSTLIASTWMGGSNDTFGDNSAGIGIDSAGNVWSSLETRSTDFPVTSDAYQSSFSGTQNIVVFALSSDLRTLVYGTYLGGVSGNAWNFQMALSPAPVAALAKAGVY